MASNGGDPNNDNNGFSSLPSHFNNDTYPQPPQSAPPLPPHGGISSTCVMIGDVPVEYTHDEVYKSLQNLSVIASDVKVLPIISPHNTLARNYALASVSGNTAPNIPPSIELQTGLPLSPVMFMFEEYATAQFALNQQLFTAELEALLHHEGQRLAVSVSFPGGTNVSVTGPCSQVYKFRQYLTTLLSHTALQYTPHSIPTTSNIPVDEPASHNVPTDPIIEEIPPANNKLETEGGGGKSFTGLSRDVLLLMTRVGTFKGMVFHPDEGRVEVLPSTEEEQDQCISKFQQSYQDITKNRQLKSGNLQVPSSFPPEELVSLFEEFNEKYNQCHFSYDEKQQSIRIISMSSRQFDQAKKLITDKLESGGAKPKGSSKQATPTHHGKIATKLGSSEVLQLSKFRKITVKRANIVEEEVDVIVNAANSQLNHAAGVAGALNKASNWELQRVSDAHTRRYGDVPVGGAVTTSKGGGKLKCKHVVHAVGPMASQQKSEEYCSELIFLAITNSLLEAEKVKAVSISFPALSTGIFSVKKSLAADAIFQALNKFHYTSTKILKDIRIVIVDEPTYSCFANHLITLKQSQTDGSGSKDDDRKKTKSPTDGTKPTTGGNTAGSSTGSTGGNTGTTTGHTAWSTGGNTGTTTGHTWSTGGNTGTTTGHTWSTGGNTGTTTGHTAWSTGGNTYGIPTVHTVSSPSTGNAPPPGFETTITTQPSGTTMNIHYPALPSTFSPSASNITTNPPTITSATGRGKGLIQGPTFIFNSPGAGRGTVGGAPLAITGSSHSTSHSHSTSNPKHFHTQLSDPTGTSSSQGEDLYGTPPATPPKSGSPTGEKGANGGGGATSTSDSNGGTPSAGGSSGGGKTEPGCPICRNDVPTDPVNTACCKQIFCRSCLYLSLQHSCYCPICKTALRPVQGNQPHGTMEYRASSLSIPGYEGCGCITITYVIPSGTQGSEHPNPGAHYTGTHRTAYLPNNPEGQQVLGLLKKAFDAKLIFTIGTSHTTGFNNTVVWNDIHHKTSIHGETYGYPDPTYLTRVKEELKAKGIQ